MSPRLATSEPLKRRTSKLKGAVSTDEHQGNLADKHSGWRDWGDVPSDPPNPTADNTLWFWHNTTTDQYKVKIGDGRIFVLAPNGPVVKTANETVSASTTFQDDDELTFQIAANETRPFHGLLIASGAEAGDMKVQWTSPSGCTVYAAFLSPTTGVTAAFGNAATWTAGYGPGANQSGGMGIDDTQTFIQVIGIAINGASAGAVTLQWAQNSASGTLTLHAGSFLSIGSDAGGAGGGGGGGGASDAADLTYTPAVLADWDGAADPGDGQEAFDQLAERTTDLEGLSHTQAHGTSDHTANGNWKTTYTNGSGDDVEIALPAVDSYPHSTGAASAPDWLDYIQFTPRAAPTAVATKPQLFSKTGVDGVVEQIVQGVLTLQFIPGEEKATQFAPSQSGLLVPSGAGGGALDGQGLLAGGTVTANAVATVLDANGLYVTLATSTTSGNVASWVSGIPIVRRDAIFQIQAKIFIDDITSVRVFVGVSDNTAANQLSAAIYGAGNYWGFRWDSSVPDAFWRRIRGNGATWTALPAWTVATPTNSVFQHMRYVGNGSQAMGFVLDTSLTYIEGQTWTTVPATTVPLSFMIGIATLSAAVRKVAIHDVKITQSYI